jgi:glycosyltransferase involved in cell wall biosynthesis
MDRPLVSIITPVYNAGAYITETVESVLGQGYEPLEYIVVDDGSTDDTREHLRAFGDAIRVETQANAGEGAAVNRGVASARGEIVGVFNADDPILPGLIVDAIAALGARPDLAGVYPDWLKIDAAGRVLETIRVPEYDYGLILRRHLSLIGPGCLYRRAALGSEPPRDTRFRYSGDFHQWLRMGLRGPFQRLPRVAATWRFHAAGTSQAQLNAALAADKIAIIRDLYERPDLPAPVAAVRDEALSAAYFSAAILALHNPGVPARQYMWASLRAKWHWGEPVIPERHRSLRLILFALGLPWTRPLNALYRRLRAERFVVPVPGPHYSVWRERPVRCSKAGECR